MAVKVNSALVFDTLTGRQVVSPLKHGGWVRYAEFSHDGLRIVTASHDGTARVWNAMTGQPLTDLLRHSAEVILARFSPDGQRVVTACEDGSVRVWDAYLGLPLSEPLKQDKAATDVCFSPDGRRVASAGADGTVRVWDLPALPLPVAAWWLDIADALAGQRFNAQGMIEPVSDEKLGTLRRLFSAENVAAPLTHPGLNDTSAPFYRNWAEWFFSGRTSRSIAPFSSLKLPQYVQERIEADGIPNLREAVCLAPTNAVALACLSRRLMGRGLDRNSREFLEAEHHLRRAEATLPDVVEVLLARAHQLDRTGRVPEALAFMERAAALQPIDPEFWDVYGIILEESVGREHDAFAKYSIGIGLAGTNSGTRSRINLLLRRSRLLRKSNRLAEAAADWCQAKEIPARDSRCTPWQLDLAGFFNVSLAEGYGGGQDLVRLPTGLQTFAGVEFDVRGVANLRGEHVDPQHTEFPPKVEGIPVTNLCHRMHFLHSAHMNVEEGTRIGAYVFHMTSGSVIEWPLVWGENVHSYFWTPWRSRSLGTNCVVAWTGSNSLTRSKDTALWLFKTTWENPQPDDLIESIDFVSDLTPCAPLLVAITLEP